MLLTHIHCTSKVMESPVGDDVWAPVPFYFLWILVWPTRLILAVNCRPRSSNVNGRVSEDSAAGTDWLVEPFRRLCFSTALAMRASSKCCTPVWSKLSAIWICCHLGLPRLWGRCPLTLHWLLDCLWNAVIVGSWAWCPTATLRKR